MTSFEVPEITLLAVTAFVFAVVFVAVVFAAVFLVAVRFVAVAAAFFAGSSADPTGCVAPDQEGYDGTTGCQHHQRRNRAEQQRLYRADAAERSLDRIAEPHADRHEAEAPHHGRKGVDDEERAAAQLGRTDRHRAHRTQSVEEAEREHEQRRVPRAQVHAERFRLAA